MALALPKAEATVLPNATQTALADPAWSHIQALSDELVEVAEVGDWSRLLILENEWLEHIKKFIVDHQAKQSPDLSVDYLENLVQINDELYQHCKTSREDLEDNLMRIRGAKHNIKQVNNSYGEY